jgi:GH24 family phage-related lysozyme (muramidase)
METVTKKNRSAAKIAAEVIKEFEGFEPKPYLCPANVPTIGYGNTMYPNGERVTMDDPEITEEQATEMLMDTIKSVEKQVKNVVEVKLPAHKLAASNILHLQRRHWQLFELYFIGLVKFKP